MSAMSRDRQRTRKRRLSRSRSRSRSSSERSSVSYCTEGKVCVPVCIPDDLVGHLMADSLKELDRMRIMCSPVTIWLQPRCHSVRRGEMLRTMLLKGDSQSQVDRARVKIHDFFRSRMQISVDGVLPPVSEPSCVNNNQDVKPLVLPSPTPTRSVSVPASPKPPEAASTSSSLYHGNLSAPDQVVAPSELTIPVFTETNEKFQEILSYVNDIIKIKFPETEVSLQPVADHDNPDHSAGPSNLILVKAASQLSAEVARMVLIKEFQDKLGVSLMEAQPELKELQEKLKKSEELVRRHEKEINNLKSFNHKLEQNRAYYKESYNRKVKNDNLNEKEFEKMKMKLKNSMSDYEMVVKEKQKLLKQVIDLQSELDEHAELIKIIKKCKNDDHPEEDQDREICLKCPQLLLEIKSLKESLSMSAALVSLREKELKLLKKKKTSDVNSSDSDD